MRAKLVYLGHHVPEVDLHPMINFSRAMRPEMARPLLVYYL